jgi:probable HAF family extracellular repeat protein
MKQIVRYALLLGIYVYSSKADQFDCSQTPRTAVRVYFGNGIDTSLSDAQDAMDDANGNGLRNLVLRALPTQFDSSSLSFCLAYDRTYYNLDPNNKLQQVPDITFQLLDAFEQKGLELTPSVISWLWNLQAVPSDVQQLVYSVFDMANEVARQDLQKQIAEYNVQLGTGSVVVVAHSQGNLYVNEVYKLIAPDPSKFSVVAVATPSDHVAGFPPGQGFWTTLHNDIITGPFGFFTYLGKAELPANWDNLPPCPILAPVACHDFLTSYLYGGHGIGSIDSGNTSGPRITSQVISLIQRSAITPNSGYTITNLSTLSGNTYGASCGRAVSPAGHVVGDIWAPVPGGDHPFLYTSSSGMIDLGLPSGSDGTSTATGVNGSDEIVGFANFDSIGGTTSRAFIFIPGTGFKDIGTLSSVGTSPMYAVPKAINALGQIVGVSSNLNSNLRSFMYSPQNGMVEIPPLAGFIDIEARAINDSGQVIGHSANCCSDRAFVYTTSTGTIDIGLPAGFANITATNVSSAGQITGTVFRSTGEASAFIYDQSGFTVLPNLPGSSYGEGVAINASGQVLGLDDMFRRPTLYTAARGVVDLNSLLPNGSGWTLNTANALNDAGQITGCGVLNGHGTSAFLLSPAR